MGNLSGVAAIFSVLVRPSLVVPHIQTPDIRHLDWSALHANGVRYLVFDKDNCLTKPHSDLLEPAISESWQQCQQVFGRENILIVSNSSGSSDDPSGLAAESLSQSLNVPVLCHSQKKPAKHCAVETLEYFVEISQSQRQAAPSWNDERKQKQMLKKGFPQDERGFGSILIVGDRTMTDVIFAHRINDELKRRRRRNAKVQSSIQTQTDPTESQVSNTAQEGSSVFTSATFQVPPPQCISVLTTGLWANEGRLNSWMRRLESRFTLFLIQKHFLPGQSGGFWFPKKQSETMTDWQSIGVAKQGPTLDMSSKIHQILMTETKDAKFSSIAEPTLGSILLMAILKPLPPRLASLVQVFVDSKPVSWLTTHLQQGWSIMIQGLEFGIRQAGLRHLPTQTGNRRKHLLNNATTPNDVLEQEIAPPPSSKRTEKHSIQSLLFPSLFHDRQRFISSRFSISPFFRRYIPSTTTTTSSRPLTIRSYSSKPSSSSRNIPMRNWMAAICAVILLPTGYMVGIYLHDYLDQKKAQKELESTPLPPSPSEKQIIHDQEKINRIQGEYQTEQRNSLGLSLFHLKREQEEIVEKLQRVRQRISAQSQTTTLS